MEKEILEPIQKNLSFVKNKILIISGKGGVGKTTVSVNLAYALERRGYKVGILDADIHGPNVAKMLGAGEKLLIADSMIEPFKVLPNLKVISMALILEKEEQPVIWRGPLKTNLIRQFLAEVRWGELDFLIIDSPPGTGDEPLSVAQFIPDLNGTIIITTPQEVAILDAKKAISFSKELGVPIIGVIENMSSFVCPFCGKEIELFGKGGGEKVAYEFGVSFLGRIPFSSSIVKSSDKGNPFIYYQDSVASTMEDVTDKILSFFKNENLT
ncbi:MAG: ATP-binding protein [Candidatus Omnitrophota bacterium]|nr:MAG: ATP-binding protein [Candidatus Omnitrophota bacterium]